MGMEKNNASNEPTPKRRKRNRGGQPGNQNGLKHGFYSSFVTRAERRKLREASKLEGLQHELDFLRVKLGTMVSNSEVTLGQVAAAVAVIARVALADHRIMGPKEEDNLAYKIAVMLNNIGVEEGRGDFGGGWGGAPEGDAG